MISLVFNQKAINARGQCSSDYSITISVHKVHTWKFNALISSMSNFGIQQIGSEHKLISSVISTGKKNHLFDFGRRFIIEKNIGNQFSTSAFILIAHIGNKKCIVSSFAFYFGYCDILLGTGQLRIKITLFIGNSYRKEWVCISFSPGSYISVHRPAYMQFL